MGHLRIDPLAFLAGAAAVLLLPLDWFFASVLAAGFHELCHFVAIRLCGGKVYALWLRSSGAVMETDALSRGAEAICAAAGPLGSLSLLLLAQWVPKLALCALVQGLFNLLPVYPLDGGRILHCFASESTCQTVQYVTVAGLVALMLWLSKYDLLFLGLAVLLSMRLLGRKIPCKEAQ